MPSRPFTLSGLAEAAGMSVDDVRFYRDSGLMQPPRRTRGRTDDFAFGAEHVERLEFIRRALACGFSHEDIAGFVDPFALVTCGDVYAIANRRLETMRRSGQGDTPMAACLASLVEQCAGVGPRKDCKIIQGLNSQGH
jgi:MerR family mercuric resistance operon transcriptional regulator